MQLKIASNFKYEAQDRDTEHWDIWCRASAVLADYNTSFVLATMWHKQPKLDCYQADLRRKLTLDLLIKVAELGYVWDGEPCKEYQLLKLDIW